MTTAFFRAVILYFVLVFGLRLMGKRQIGDLEPSELVLTLIIADLASVPMQDYGIPLFNGLLPIVVLLSLSMLISFCSLKSIRFRTLLCGRPTVIVRDGKLCQQAMRRNRLTVDELFEQLRSSGYSDLSAVKYAILETSGQLSILPYAEHSPTTPYGMGQTTRDNTALPYLIVSDGRLLRDNLRDSGYDEAWLKRVLKERKLRSHAEVFLLSVDEEGTITCIKKEENG